MSLAYGKKSMQRFISFAAEPQAFFLRLFSIIAILIALEHDASICFRHNVPFQFDLRAFYCGAHVTAGGANPYLFEPLRSCESGLDRAPRFPLPAFALPAPLPPYALFLASPFGVLAPSAAIVVFELILISTTVLIIAGLHRLTQLRYDYFIAPIIFGVHMPAAELGQIAPFCLLGVIYAALFYRERRYSAAALAMWPCCLQPQIGLVIAGCVFCADPRMRRPLVVLLGVPLVLITLLNGSLISDYLKSLVFQAVAELRENEQYSLAFFFYQLHVPATSALKAGSVATLVWIASAFFALTKYRTGDPMIVAVPALCAVLPGTYEHALYFVYMLPCAYLLIARGRATQAAAMGVAVLTMLVYPFGVLKLTLISLVSVAAALTTVWAPIGGSRTSKSIMTAIIAGVFFVLARHTPIESPAVPAHTPPHLASESWAQALAHQPGLTPGAWFKKVPKVASIVLIAAATCFGASRKPSNPDEDVSALGQDRHVSAHENDNTSFGLGQLLFRMPFPAHIFSSLADASCVTRRPASPS